MLCEMCKEKEANVVIQTVAGGRAMTRSLCAECARKTQSEIAKAFFALGIRLQQARRPEREEAAVSGPLPRKICSSCGTPITEIDEDSLFGCAGCYVAFSDMIQKAFPPVAPVDFERSEVAEPSGDEDVAEREKIARRLRQAVFAEDYELAAALRDRLKSLAGGAEPPEDSHG